MLNLSNSGPGHAPTVQRRPRRLFISLGLQVSVLVVLLLATVASGIYLGLVRQSRLALLESKEAAADLVVKLTSLSVSPAVVFDDEQEMQRAVSNLARNPDVSDVELWALAPVAAPDTPAPLAKFHRMGSASLGRPASQKSQLTRGSDSIRFVEPVNDVEGKPIALLVVRFSTSRELAAMARLARQILLVAAATALSLAVAILLAIHRIVVRPVRQLERAAMRLARGEGHQVDSGERRVEDEVVRLANKFGEMAEAVRDREVRLGARNAELKLILDSVDQGFLTARMDGTLLPERSAIVDRWLGKLSPDATLWSLAGLIEPGMDDVMSLGWQQLLDDFLPREVALDQLPKRLTRDRQHFNVAYHPEVVDDRLQHLVIVITDISAEIERQRSLLEQQEFAALVEQFVHDRRGFHTFWNEACDLVASITEDSPDTKPSLRRDLHTLKGNARFFRVNRVSSLCHDLESAMGERGTFELTTRERESLKDLWDSLRERMDPILVGQSSFLEMSREQYDSLLAAVRERQLPQDLERLVRGFRSESLHARLARLSEVLDISCRRLGKTPPKVEIQGADPRLPPRVWARFWAVFPHVLNNAADHGLEDDQERVRVGKGLPGTVSMSGSVSDAEFVLEVRDDGHGIDWDRLRRVTAERGLPHDSRKCLEQALFVEGLSLKAQVSEISGRGVGLPALRSVVLEMGGDIELDSEYGGGTTWRFRFPLRLLSEAESEDDRT